MKIAISGPQCVGKTTLINSIAEKYGDEIVIYKEVVRAIKKRWAEKGKEFRFNEVGDFDSQMAIFEEHHRNVLYSDDIVLTDRCAWDAFVYATYNYLKGDFTFQEYKKFEEIFVETIELYDLIIYLPPGLLDLQSDGVRSASISFQHSIGELFIKIADQYDIECDVFDELDGRVEHFSEIYRDLKIYL